jgi:cyclase
MAAQQVAHGVYAVDQSVVEGKNGVVIGARRAVAIDSGNGPEDGLALVEVLRRHGRPPDRLVLTHGHGDHVLGGAPFRDGEVYAHVECAPTMRRHMPALVARRGCDPATLAWPTVTFSDRLELDLGGKTLRLVRTPGHSPDGVSVYLPEDRVLFGGDAVVTGIVPAIQDGDSRQLEASLRRLLALEVETLVPGHGPVVRGPDAVRDWLSWEAAYLAGVRDAVRAWLRAGADPDALAGGVPFERHVAPRLPADRHGMAGRHRDTVAKIAREEADGR